MRQHVVEITCPKCGVTLAIFSAPCAANAYLDTYEAPFLWIPDYSLEFQFTHRIEHVLNDRQDVSRQRRRDVQEARELGSTVRKRHRFDCHPCRQSLPVKEDRLWPTLDKLAGRGVSSIDLDLLGRSVTRI